MGAVRVTRRQPITGQIEVGVYVTDGTNLWEILSRDDERRDVVLENCSTEKCEIRKLVTVGGWIKRHGIKGRATAATT